MDRWDDDDEMFRNSFENFKGKSSSDKISMNELDNKIYELKKRPDLDSFLDKMRKSLACGNSLSSTEIGFDYFKQSCLNIPMVKRHRMEWVRSLHLDEALAKKLHAGVLWDGLQGLRKMTLQQIKVACDEFADDIRKQVMTEWESLRLDAGQGHGGGYDKSDERDAQAVMSKFREDAGVFSGNFGDQSFFHEGLESKLGLADPCIFRAILREHVIADECKDCFMPLNYFIYTNPQLEYARLFAKEEFIAGIPKFLLDKAREQPNLYPAEGELIEAKSLFDEIRKVQDIIKKNRGGIYPGDIGSKILEIQLTCSAMLDAADHFRYVEMEVADVASKFAKDHRILEDGEDGLHGLLCTCSRNSGAEGCDLRFDLILQFGPSKGRELDARDNVVEGTKNRFLEHLRNVKHVSDFHVSGFRKQQEKIYQYCKYKKEKSVEDLIQGERKKSESLDLGAMNLGDLGFTDLFLESKFPKQERLTSMRCAEAVRVLGLEGDVGQGIIKLWNEESEFLLENNIHRRQGRRSLGLEELMGLAHSLQPGQAEVASLRFEEAIQQYQYTGPLYQKWNSVLRRMGGASTANSGNKYATSIHTLVSAVLKTAKATRIPESRKVYRGLGGMALDDKWFEPNARGAKGGVELGFLSTTLDRNVALKYSGAKENRGVILEIDVGEIDCGARLDAVSQYPGEGELLFGPLSNLEALGTRLEKYEDAKTEGGNLDTKPVITVSLKINSNLKALAIEEMISKRKKMMVNILHNLREELVFDLTILDLKWEPSELKFELLPSNWFDRVPSVNGKHYQNLLSADDGEVEKQIENIIATIEKHPFFFQYR